MCDVTAVDLASSVERIAIADAYLAALLSHDGGSVRFHPDAVRYEAGIKTGFSGRHLTRSLTSGLQFRLVTGIRTPSWSIHDDRVIAEYVLDAGFAGLRFAPLHITETFVIPREDPRIHRIDVEFHRSVRRWRRPTVREEQHDADTP